jgi:hypothetical protein
MVESCLSAVEVGQAVHYGHEELLVAAVGVGACVWGGVSVCVSVCSIYMYVYKYEYECRCVCIFVCN